MAGYLLSTLKKTKSIPHILYLTHISDLALKHAEFCWFRCLYQLTRQNPQSSSGLRLLKKGWNLFPKNIFVSKRRHISLPQCLLLQSSWCHNCSHLSLQDLIMILIIMMMSHHYDLMLMTLIIIMMLIIIMTLIIIMMLMIIMTLIIIMMLMIIIRRSSLWCWWS